MKKINGIKIIKFVALILLILALIIGTIYMIPIIKKINTIEGQIEFKNKIENSGIIGILIVFGLELAQVIFAILPGEPIEILAGICFGPIWGTIILMISMSIVTAMIYFFVKKYGKDFIYEFFDKDKVNKLENSKLLQDEKKIEIVLAILFLLPGTPKDLLVYIGGLLPIKSSRFILISTLLRFPSVISSTILGGNLIEGKWKLGIIVYVITIIITIIIVAIINKLDKNKVTEDVIKSVKNKEIS